MAKRSWQGRVNQWLGRMGNKVDVSAALVRERLGLDARVKDKSIEALIDAWREREGLPDPGTDTDGNGDTPQEAPVTLEEVGAGLTLLKQWRIGSLDELEQLLSDVAELGGVERMKSAQAAAVKLAKRLPHQEE